MSIVSFLVLYSTVLVTAAVAAKLSKLHYLPETDMNVTQIIRYNGYPAEEYSVVTDDGYIIYIQRIPSGRNQDPSTGPKPVIFVQHGLLCSSSNWVINLPNESFAFVLADAGFDVWLGNVRGNTYGLRHVKYPVHSDEFWNFRHGHHCRSSPLSEVRIPRRTAARAHFVVVNKGAGQFYLSSDTSWDEMASQDLPAMLNFVTNKTSQSSIYYAAHSQGTLMAFAEFSRNKELAKKVKKFFAMGPVATVGHMESPIKYLADAIDEIEILFYLFGVRDFLPSDAIIHWLAKHVCSDKDLETFCSDIIFIICGFDKKQLNETRLPIYYTHTPAGTSVRNMVHFAQMYKSKKFQMYDYGNSKENKKHYGQPTPPRYNASDMTVPVALYWAQNDWLADPTDVKALLPLLPNKLYNKSIENWDHLDFIWGMDAAKIVYDHIIRNIE